MPSHTFRQCRREAVEGSTYCEVHNVIRGDGHLPRSYKSRMRPVLVSLVEEQMGETEAFDHLKVDEEVALLRVLTGSFVEMYGASLESENVSPTTIAACGAAMQQALTTVIDAADKAAKLTEARAKLQGAVAASLENVINLVLRSAYEVWGTDMSVKRFEEKLREKLKTRGLASAAGTDLTPDVTEMDNTVP